jgi:hypothetical protein
VRHLATSGPIHSSPHSFTDKWVEHLPAPHASGRARRYTTLQRIPPPQSLDVAIRCCRIFLSLSSLKKNNFPPTVIAPRARRLGRTPPTLSTPPPPSPREQLRRRLPAPPLRRYVLAGAPPSLCLPQVGATIPSPPNPRFPDRFRFPSSPLAGLSLCSTPAHPRRAVSER